MLPQIFRLENPVLTIHFSPEHPLELEKLLEALDKETFQASESWLGLSILANAKQRRGQ